MNKKELEPIKDKYIYQRYKGRITKYIIREDFECYIEASTGFTTNIKSTFRGKTSENIIDLIEVGDFVNGYRVLEIKNSIYENSKIILIYRSEKENYERWIYIQEYNGKVHTQDDIKTILTHEQYKQNAYEVEE